MRCSRSLLAAVPWPRAVGLQVSPDGFYFLLLSPRLPEQTSPLSIRNLLPLPVAQTLRWPGLTARVQPAELGQQPRLAFCSSELPCCHPKEGEHGEATAAGSAFWVPSHSRPPFPPLWGKGEVRVTPSHHRWEKVKPFEAQKQHGGREQSNTSPWRRTKARG